MVLHSFPIEQTSEKPGQDRDGSASDCSHAFEWKAGTDFICRNQSAHSSLHIHTSLRVVCAEHGQLQDFVRGRERPLSFHWPLLIPRGLVSIRRKEQVELSCLFGFV